ncbi:PH domain-containing protein [Rhodohalobacter mucosus]|uniref:PH domain-containing protein n=1 Tax=Rhodohalobacter mucosus TaxID=2079485 RepID=A0A316TLR4_9BACT|nr:PH domain-containing protein [Rhodohalobacter mucosus]PWN05330.1 hypothetical protein DDZ15_14780 [Rhodohalobacter mucosus]
MFQKEIQLKSGEQILLRSRMHPGLMIAGCMIIFYAIFVSIFTGYISNLISAGFGALFMIIGFFKWSYYEFILTDSRLLKVSGYYYIRAEEVLLEKVGHVTLWQNKLDRWWDRGIITLYGIGIRTQKIRGVSNASSFRNAIHSQLSVEPEHYFE